MPFFKPGKLLREMFSIVIIAHLNVEFYICIYIMVYIREELGKILGDKIVIRCRSLGRVASVRRWTKAAIDCYQRGCVCEGCYYKEFFSDSPQRCLMKNTVLELVRVLGRPQNVEPKESVIY